MDFFRRQDWDIVGKAPIWLTISGVIILFGIIWWATHGLNYGIDFTGGELIRYQIEQPLSGAHAEESALVAEVRDILQNIGIEKSQIQISGDNQIFIRISDIGEETVDEERSRQIENQILQGLEDRLGEKYGTVTVLGREKVGPVVGQQLREKAFYALLIGAVLILIFITIRYEFRFAVAAICALLHDIMIVMTGVAILQIELDSAFVAAILTVVGYSINDTVVIFDRVRENRKLHRGTGFGDTINISLMQTMTRSINTTVTTLFTLIALAGWGGATIQGFALALIIGITTGAYSSVFVASPIVYLWDRMTATSDSVAQRRRRAAARDTREDQTEAKDEEEEAEEGEKRSAKETMRQAEAKAREEKRKERRERRKKKDSGSKRRY
ncbi:MAG: protein translocase subunit SecF [Armatimonadota bacterium]